MTRLIQEDEIDIDCVIGGGNNPSEESETIESEQWEIIEAEVVITAQSSPDYVDMRITPATDTTFPKDPSVSKEDGGYLGRNFTLDVETDLRADVEGPSHTRLFTGKISNMTALGDYSYEAIAHDPTQEPFLSTSEEKTYTSIMNQSIELNESSSVEIIGKPSGPFYGEEGVLTDARIRVSDLLDLILDEIGIDDESVAEENLQEDGSFVVTTRDGAPIKKGKDIELTFSNWEVKIKDALEYAALASGSKWWFDRFGKFHFGPPIPNENIYAYELRYITDATDSLTRPPYQSVRVIGDGVVSQDGWSKSKILNEKPITTGDSIKEVESGAELVEPTFTYRNMEINTEEEARTVRESLVEDIKSQQADGEVTVVGFPEIRPLDVIVMPDTDRQPMGGYRYGVDKVVHRLNNSDGFLTKIGISEVVGTQLGLGEGSLEEREEELTPDWDQDKIRTSGGF